MLRKKEAKLQIDAVNPDSNLSSWLAASLQSKRYRHYSCLVENKERNPTTGGAVLCTLTVLACAVDAV